MKKRKLISIFSASTVILSSAGATVSCYSNENKNDSKKAKIVKIQNLLLNHVTFKLEFLNDYKNKTLNEINDVLNSDLSKINEEMLNIKMKEFYSVFDYLKSKYDEILSVIKESKKIIQSIDESNLNVQNIKNKLNEQIDFSISSIDEYFNQLSELVDKFNEDLENENSEHMNLTIKVENLVKNIKKEISNNKFKRFEIINNETLNSLEKIIDENLENKEISELKLVINSLENLSIEYDKNINKVTEEFNKTLILLNEKIDYLTNLQNNVDASSDINNEIVKVMKWINKFNFNEFTEEELNYVYEQLSKQLLKIKELINEQNSDDLITKIRSLSNLSDEIINFFIEEINKTNDKNIVVENASKLNQSASKILELLSKNQNILNDINYLDSSNKDEFDNFWNQLNNNFYNKKLINKDIDFDQINQRFNQLLVNFDGNSRIEILKQNNNQLITNIKVIDKIKNDLNQLNIKNTRLKEFSEFNDKLIVFESKINDFIDRYNVLNNVKSTELYNNAPADKKQKFEEKLNLFSNLLSNSLLNIFTDFDTTLSELSKIISENSELEKVLEKNEIEKLEEYKEQAKENVKNKNIFSEEMLNKIISIIEDKNSTSEIEEVLNNVLEIEKMNENIKNSMEQINQIKNSEKYKNATEESKLSFENKVKKYDEIYENNKIKSFETIQLVIEKQKELISTWTNIEEILKKQESNNTSENTNNSEQINTKINLIKEKITNYRAQNYYVDNFESKLTELSASNQVTMEDLTKLEGEIETFINDVKSLPTNYNNLISLTFTPLELEKKYSGEYYLKEGQTVTLKVEMLYNNRTYSLRYFKSHNILIRYRFYVDARKDSWSSVESNQINWENSTITLIPDKYNSTFGGVVRYNQDIDNSIATKQVIKFTKDDRVQDNAVTDPKSIKNYDIIQNKHLSNTHTSNRTEVQNILSSYYNNSYSSTVLDSKNITYRDAMWIMFLNLFNSANFENKSDKFNIESEQFNQVFDQNGSFIYEINAISKQNLTDYKFTSLGGSFFDMILTSTSYNNKFNIGVNDKIKFIFSYTSNGQTPTIINSNQGDLSAVGSNYNIVGKYPFLMNIEGVFNFKIYINDNLKMNVSNTDANQLQSIPVFVLRKTDTEVIIYTTSSKVSIG